MKTFWILFILSVASNILNAQTLSWKFYEAGTTKSYDLGEKGTVQQTLYNDSVLPNPFYGMNESKYQWIEQKDWIFVSAFDLSPEQMAQKYIELCFGNVDTYATIYVNGHEVGKTASFFIPYRFNIKEWAKLGVNKVEIHFVSPINYHRKAYDSLKVKFPAPNDVYDSIAVAPMSRKPQFQFGWDWSLRINTIGLNKPAFVDCYSSNKVLQTSVQTLELTENTAKMRLFIQTSQPIDDSFRWENKLLEKTELYSGKTSENTYEVTFELENPKLYWPVGYGEQNLYREHLKIFQDDQEIYNNDDLTFGVAHKEIVQKEDQYGTSFEIHWNGKFIFCKGGDYIPQDIFISSIDNQRLKEMIDDCVAANFNMIRIWGGGYYLPDFFYRYCAEKGIMIWQDFMFACALYPADSTFLNLVKQEVDYQVPRISAFPNIAIFNGNNEVMVASKYWGFKQKYHIDDSTQAQFDRNYKELFQTLIPNELAKYSSVPYIHTSPLSHWGKDEYYRHGTQHYWGVWHGSDPVEDFAYKSGRFNAEYGFQSFPEYSTLLKFSTPADWDLNSAVMKEHQKSSVGNGMILKQTKYLFGTPTDFEDFVYRSQLTQAEAVGLAFASQRLQYPRVAGTLYWQVDDCWPVSSWSSVDYYGNWKALHYRAQKDFAPITVLRNLEVGGQYKYYLFSDLPGTKTVELTMEVYETNGQMIYSNKWKTNIAQFSKLELTIPAEKLNDKRIHLVKFQWNYNNHSLKRSFLIDERKYAIPQGNLIIKELKDLGNGKAKLVIDVKKFSAYTWLTSKNGNIFVPNNFRHLLPGEQIIEFDYKGEMPKISDLMIKHL